MTPKPTDSPSRDLSRDIESAMRRSPHEIVRCTRTSGNHYRCNWWGPDNHRTATSEGLLLWATTTTHRVTASRFLHATERNGQLTILDVDPRGVPVRPANPSPTPHSAPGLRDSDNNDAAGDIPWR
jgi:hypothetical protein